MWIQATLTKDDLAGMVRELTPLRLDLGAERYLFLGRPKLVELIPDEGLRLACDARVRMGLAGFRLPVKVDDLRVVLRPSLQKRGERDVLGCRLRVEEADLKAVPGFLDAKIVARVNKALRDLDAKLVWDFQTKLSFGAALPKALLGPSAFGLDVTLGDVKITAETVALTIAFRARVTRDDRADTSADTSADTIGGDEAPREA